MKNDVYFWDIETSPAPNAAAFIEEPTPPGSMKKADTIAEWERTEKPKIKAKRLEEAALSAITGRVLVIGFLTPQNVFMYLEGNEDAILKEFWSVFRQTQLEHTQKPSLDWLGWNSTDFDWPFVCRRSFVLGIKPAPIFNDRGYVQDNLRDLRRVWGCGERMPVGDLATLCKLMGLPGKKEGMTGADFAATYAQNRELALEYLKGDLLATKALAERLL